MLDEALPAGVTMGGKGKTNPFVWLALATAVSAATVAGVHLMQKKERAVR